MTYVVSGACPSFLRTKVPNRVKKSELDFRFSTGVPLDSYDTELRLNKHRRETELQLQMLYHF